LVQLKISTMADIVEEKDMNKFIIVGDRILIRPKKDQQKTKSGLYLPPGIKEKEEIYSGYVIKVGPGYPIPAIVEVDEPWKKPSDEIRYVPLQPQEGDLAIYLQKSAYDIEFKGEKYVIVSQSSILMLIRDEDLFD